MLRNILALALAVGMTASVAGGRNLSTAKPWMDNAHKSMHLINIVDTDTRAAGFCTAHAVGRHALLTAEHCFLDEKKPQRKVYYALFVDGEKLPTLVTAVYSDHADHVILLLNHADFKNTLPLVIADPVQGEEVVMWGNPGGVLDQFRMGYVIGYGGLVKTPIGEKMPMWAYDLAGWPGDSGAAVIDADDGHLVGLDSYGFGPHTSGCFPLRFTSQQIAAANQ